MWNVAIFQQGLFINANYVHLNLQAEGCNPILTFFQAGSIEYNEIYFWGDMHRMALKVYMLIQHLISWNLKTHGPAITVNSITSLILAT